MAKSKLHAQVAILQKLSEEKVEIGWFPENRQVNGESTAQVMAYNEFGSDKTPARPLMRQAAAIVDTKIDGYISRRISDALKGKLDPELINKLIGEVVRKEVVDQFKEGGFAPNAPSTIAAKGFNMPLTDTGNAAQTVQYKVSKK